MWYFAHALAPAQATKVEKLYTHRLRWLDHVPFKDADRDRHPVGVPSYVCIVATMEQH